MKLATKPIDEETRLKSLRDLKILDSSNDVDFNELTFLASQVCETPIALISFVDKDRLWFKSTLGLELKESPREFSFCAQTILQNNIFLVNDVRKDERFKNNALAIGKSQIRFYAGIPLMSPDGQPIGTICVLSTEVQSLNPNQVRSLEALSHQATRLLILHKQVDELKFKRTAMESILEGVVLQDNAGNIIVQNRAAAEILSNSAKKESEWKAIREDGTPIPPEIRPSMLAIRDKEPIKNFIMGLNMRQNHWRWLKINSNPIFLNDNQTPSHVVSTFADITENLENEKIIHANEKKLRKILDGVPAMVGIWNNSLVNISANQAYLEYFGKTAEQIKGIHLKDLIGLDNFERENLYIENVLSGKAISFEKDIIDHQGRLKHTLNSYIPNVENEKIEGFLAVITDITEIKRLETQMIESSRLSVLGEMAVGIAHEVNNPLTIINGKIKSLKRKLEKGELDIENHLKEFQRIEETVRRIAKIIIGLRSYSRNAYSDPFGKTKVLEVIQSTLVLCTERFKDNNIEIKLTCDPTLIFECRATQISQILMNLLLNSFEAIEENKLKWVNLVVTDEDEFVKITYSDSGHGIPAHIASKMMNPFFTTKEIGKGTGLGLSTSQGIAEAHGGFLRYIPEAINTTFILALPKKQKN